MPSNPQSRITTQKIRGQSRRTCRVPVLLYQRSGRNPWPPRRSNRRLCFSWAKSDNGICAETETGKCADVKKSKENKIVMHTWNVGDGVGREKRWIAAYPHACSADQGLVQDLSSCVFLGRWKLVGFLAALRRVWPTIHTYSPPPKGASTRNLPNNFPLSAYVALFCVFFFYEVKVYWKSVSNICTSTLRGKQVIY